MSAQVEYEFQDVCGIYEGAELEGLKFSGTALLKSSYPDESDDEFYVQTIYLDGGLMLNARGSVGGFPSEGRAWLFKIIASVIEKDEMAQEMFSEQVRG